MKVNIVKLIPKGWLIEDRGDKIKVNYKLKKGNYNRKPFILRKEIIIEVDFFEALGFYLGDGDYNNKNKAHLSVVSKDKELIKLFLDFLIKYFCIESKDITILIQYKMNNLNLEKEWLSYLKINNKILSRFSKRHKEEACSLQVNGVVFRKIFEIIIKNILKSDFLSNNKFRRAFLRGVFAAEGNVGIDYIERKPYISQINFTISSKETMFSSLICKALDLEYVKYKLYNRNNSTCIDIFNWDNYLKLYNLNLFYLCKRKNDKFEDIAKNLNVYFSFNKQFRKTFFSSLNMNQKEIAKIIYSWQPNISRIINGMHLLKIEQVLKLIDHSKFNKKHIIENLDYIRIGNTTKIKINNILLKFLKEFKSF